MNSTGNGTTGTGDSGTLPYVVGLANANINTAGSEIEFDPTVFASPQTITLASTLVLSETAGPEVIDGLGASIVTVSGGGAVEVFSVTSGVTASLTGLTISGGSATQGGGLSVVGGSVSLTNVAVSDNASVGANAVSAGGAGGTAIGGGIYLAGGTLTLNDDVIRGNVARGGAGGTERWRYWCRGRIGGRRRCLCGQRIGGHVRRHVRVELGYRAAGGQGPGVPGGAGNRQRAEPTTSRRESYDHEYCIPVERGPRR